MNALVPYDSVRSLRLVHYTKDPDMIVPGTVAQKPDGDMKPEGLWVSVLGEYGWKDWCESGSFRLENLAHVHAVTLSPTARILHLSGARDIDAFTESYAEEHPVVSKFYCVNWARVEADGYHGIVISPYCWERRLDGNSRWYYGWDCASGCIWNADAIESVTLMEGERAGCPTQSR